MPRIRQYAAAYAEEDFRKEILRKICDRYGSSSVRALAQEAGLSQSSLNTKIRSTTRNLDINDLSIIIPILKPDITVVLKLLGYDSAAIQKYKNKKTEE